MKNPTFWEIKKLSELNSDEWESLCDGCGKCCVIKLIDEDTNHLHYTNISCHLLDTENCSCKNYKDRKKIVKDCVKLSPNNLDDLKWLPSTCAYKLINEGKKLPNWHPLVQGDKSLMVKGKHSVTGRVIPENKIDKKNITEYIFNWDGKEE